MTTFPFFGMRGLYDRDSLDVDSVRNRNRKSHGCFPTGEHSHGYTHYRTLCGIQLAVPSGGEESTWSDVVWPNESGKHPSCKRCKRHLTLYYGT